MLAKAVAQVAVRLELDAETQADVVSVQDQLRRGAWCEVFWRRDEVSRAWEFVGPILDAYENKASLPIHTYEKGSLGPAAADELITRSRRKFRDLV